MYIAIAMNMLVLTERLPAPLRSRIRAFRQHAARRSFAWNVSVMLAGTIVGQGISILLSPILTRVFTPSEFGYLSVYSSVLFIVCVVASLGLELAIPIASCELEAANLLALCGISLVATTVLVTFAIYALPPDLLASLWIGDLASYRYLLPIGFACLGSYYIMVAIATRAAAFQDIARTRISQGLSGPLSQLVLGLLHFGTPGLAIGFVIGQSSGTLLLYWRVVVRLRAFSGVSWHGIVAAVRRYIHFPLFASWARMLDMAGSGTVLFVLFSTCYSSDIAGFMFLSDRVISRPLLVVSTSLLQVFVGEAGHSLNHDPAALRRRFYQVMPRQFLLSLGWILLANLIAARAFPLLFGEQWAAAIPYLHAGSAAYLGLAVLHPVSTMLQMLERQVAAAVWQVFRVVLVIGGFMIGWRSGLPAVTTLWICSILQLFSILVVLGMITWSIERLARRDER
jgi:O-antigen/teichoic acid export membrane protein